MGVLVRVSAVEHIEDRRLRVIFSDGLVREFDFAGVLHGVLATIDDDQIFSRVTVDRTAGTLCWPNGIDLDPDVLHGEHEQASGQSPQLLREYRLQQTG